MKLAQPVVDDLFKLEKGVIIIYDALHGENVLIVVPVLTVANQTNGWYQESSTAEPPICGHFWAQIDCPDMGGVKCTKQNVLIKESSPISG